MGDFTAKGMTAGYFGTYAAMADEGVLRIYSTVPGLDTWTYGFHPKRCDSRRDEPIKRVCRNVGRQCKNVSG